MRRTISDVSYSPKSGGHTPRALLFPVRSFGRAILQLTKALTECQDDPRAETVHTLRKASRRLEAQLTLLHLLQDRLTPGCIDPDGIKKPLKRLSRAAGRVRDLDAQEELVVRDASRKLQDNPNYAQESLAQEATHLSKRLAKRRNVEALRLVQVLKKERGRLIKALRDAGNALQSFEDQSFTAEDLNIRIRKWLRAAVLHLYEPQGTLSPNLLGDGGKGTDHLDSRMVDRLHGLRKVAKSARYMVESLSSKAAGSKQLISELKTTQKSGGEWHDWLLIQRMAAKHFRKRTGLAKQYAKHRDAALADYIKVLARRSWVQPATRPVDN